MHFFVLPARGTAVQRIKKGCFAGVREEITIYLQPPWERELATRAKMFT
jgi:hypothetical protein